VDRFLRGGVLVDLFSIVRQGVRVSQESYSLKKVEKLYMPQREGPKTRPGFALVEYEKWMEHPDQQSILTACRLQQATGLIWKMRTWLEGKRTEGGGIRISSKADAEDGDHREGAAARGDAGASRPSRRTSPRTPPGARRSSTPAGSSPSSSTGTGARPSRSGGSTSRS
jgi:hypothetical protein